MNSCNPVITTWDEHQFWLEILQDHAFFVRDFLAPVEEQAIKTANDYIFWFQHLRNRLVQLDKNLPASSPEMTKFAQQVYPVAYNYFLFEGQLQRLRLLNQIYIELTPTYFNGTLGENQEYLRLLSYFMRGEQPPELPLVLQMDLWIEDQLGHAALLRNNLDPVEIALSEQARAFMERFQALIIKNEHIKKYLRFIEEGFPGQQRFARDVAEVVIQFYVFVEMIHELFKEDEVLSRLTLRFIEHHFPESCYFLRKLALFEPEIYDLPDCPLTKPSFNTVAARFTAKKERLNSDTRRHGGRHLENKSGSNAGNNEGKRADTSASTSESTSAGYNDDDNSYEKI